MSSNAYVHTRIDEEDERRVSSSRENITRVNFAAANSVCECVRVAARFIPFVLPTMAENPFLTCRAIEGRRLEGNMHEVEIELWFIGQPRTGLVTLLKRNVAMGN
jgi:hypothetical protein